MYLLQKASFGRKILKNPQTGKKFVLPSNKYFKTKTTKEGVVFYAGENPITDPVCEVKIDSSDILTCREKSGLSIKINPSNGNYTPKYDFEISSRFNYGFGYLVTKTGEMHKFHFNNLNHFQTDMSLISSKNIKLSSALSSQWAYIIKKTLKQQPNKPLFGVMDSEGGLLTPFIFASDRIEISVSPDWLIEGHERALLGFKEGDKNVLTYSSFGNAEIIDELPANSYYYYLSEKHDKEFIIAGYDDSTKKSTIMTYIPKSELQIEHNKSFVKVEESVYDGKVLQVVKHDSNVYKKYMVVERDVNGSYLKGIIDETGREVFPVSCESIVPVSKYEFRIIRNEEMYYLDLFTGSVVSEKDRQKEMQQKYNEHLEYERKQQEKQQKQDEDFEKWLDEEIEVDMKEYTQEDFNGTGFLEQNIVKMTRRAYLEQLEQAYEEERVKTGNLFGSRHDEPRKVMYREFLKNYKPEYEPGNE